MGIKGWKLTHVITKQASDLMKKIFCRESKRINIEEMLLHPYIASIRLRRADKDRSLYNTKKAHEIDTSMLEYIQSPSLVTRRSLSAYASPQMSKKYLQSPQMSTKKIGGGKTKHKRNSTLFSKFKSFF